MDSINFYKTYIWKRDPRHYLLKLCHESKECPFSYLEEHQRKETIFRIAKDDNIGFHTLSVSIGWADRIQKFRRHEIEAMYTHLKQKLTDEGIQALYPDIALEYRNRKCLRNNTREQQQLNHLRNIGKLPKGPDKYIQHITQHMGVRESAPTSVR